MDALGGANPTRLRPGSIFRTQVTAVVQCVEIASAVDRTCTPLLFRSRDLISQSDEADLVRDVCFVVDKAQTKLKAIRRRSQGLQEYTAAELQLLTAADSKLTAAMVAALLSIQGQR